MSYVVGNADCDCIIHSEDKLPDTPKIELHQLNLDVNTTR
jgi:hypothetical protein